MTRNNSHIIFEIPQLNWLIIRTIKMKISIYQNNGMFLSLSTTELRLVWNDNRIIYFTTDVMKQFTVFKEWVDTQDSTATQVGSIKVYPVEKLTWYE